MTVRVALVIFMDRDLICGVLLPLWKNNRFCMEL